MPKKTLSQNLWTKRKESDIFYKCKKKGTEQDLLINYWK